MTRFMKGGLLALLFFVSALPASAANLPLLDPNFSIVPTECTSCPCGAGGALQLIQNMMNAAISIGVIAFVLIITYAGFLLILTPTNPEARSKAKTVLGNAVIGFLIVLCAWLVVDFIMKLLYSSSTETSFGPWNKILTVTDSSKCIEPQDVTPISGLPGVVGVGINPVTGATGTGSGGAGYGVGVTRGLCADSNSACSVAAISQYGLSTPQAQAMSCIAVTESGGNPNVGKSSTGACGTFQITTRPGNWSIPKYHKSPCSTSSSCNNAACNLQTAMIMFKEQGYQPWTGKNPNGSYWNPNAVACVAKYNPGN